jgi:Rod binding domain-containing protein
LSNKIQSSNIQNPSVQKINEKYKHVPKEIIDVAEGMESQFINHMINEMRKSVHKVEPESQAERFYNSKIDEEYSKIMSGTKSGLGIKEMIIEQLAPQYIRQPKLAKFNQGLRTYQQQEVDSTKGGSHE